MFQQCMCVCARARECARNTHIYQMSPIVDHSDRLPVLYLIIKCHRHIMMTFDHIDSWLFRWFRNIIDENETYSNSFLIFLFNINRHIIVSAVVYDLRFLSKGIRLPRCFRSQCKGTSGRSARVDEGDVVITIVVDERTYRGRSK